MGSISGSNSKTKTSSYTRPNITRTPFSSIDLKNRSITLDPTIRATQDKAMQDYAGLYGDLGDSIKRFSGQTSDLRGRVLGNAGDYINAAVSPLEQQYATRRGELMQSQGRRGIAGSSFADQSVNALDIGAKREIGDARAMAVQNLAEFENQLNAQELAAWNDSAQRRAQITGETLEVAKAKLAQELNSFGVGGSKTKGTTSNNSTGFSLTGEYKSGGATLGGG